MNNRTAEAYTELKNAIAAGQTRIVPAIFSHCFGRAAASAAFRLAKRDGIIEVAYYSMTGSPVYQAAGTKAAVAEAASSVKH